MLTHSLPAIRVCVCYLQVRAIPVYYLPVYIIPPCLSTNEVSRRVVSGLLLSGRHDHRSLSLSRLSWHQQSFNVLFAVEESTTSRTLGMLQFLDKRLTSWRQTAAVRMRSVGRKQTCVCDSMRTLLAEMKCTQRCVRSKSVEGQDTLG